MADIFDWSVVAASNNNAAPNGFPEGMNYSDVNNAAREVMAVLARWYADTNGSLVTGGTGNAYTITANRNVTSYVNGLEFAFRANRANTGAVTLNVSGVGPTALNYRDGTALRSGDLKNNGNYRVIYNSTTATWVMDDQAATDSHRGIVELATNAEALAGTDATRALVPANFNDKTFSGTGHQKIAGGLILQWGQSGLLGNIGAGVQSSSVATSTTFPNAVLMANCFAIADGGDPEDVVVYWNKAATTTSAIHMRYEELGGATQSSWRLGFIAIGY